MFGGFKNNDYLCSVDFNNNGNIAKTTLIHTIMKTVIRMKKAWSFGSICDSGAFRTKAEAIKARNEAFKGLYTKAEFDELLPCFQILAPIDDKGQIMNSRYDLFERV